MRVALPIRLRKVSDPRAHRLIVGVATSLVSRGIGALGPVVTLPILLPALGPRLFGVWAAAVALASLVTWADLGLGSSLLTRLAALGDSDPGESRRLISVAYSVVGSVALALVGVLFLTSAVVNLGALLGVKDGDLASAGAIVLGVLILLALNVVLGLVHRILNGAQCIGTSNLILSAGNALSPLLALAAIGVKAGPASTAIAASAGPVIANLAATAWVFIAKMPQFRPMVQRPRGEDVRGLLGLGSAFLVVSVLTAISLTLDPVLVAHIDGAESAAAFSVAIRVLGVLGLTITLVNAPLWPVQGEALRRGDFAWVRRVTLRMTVISVVSVALGGVAIFAVRTPLFSLLGAGDLMPSAALLAALSLWWCLIAGASPLFMVQNAAGVVLPQMLGWGLMAVAATSMKVAVLSAGASTTWLVLAGSICYCVFVIPFAVRGYRAALARSGEKRGDPCTRLGAVD